MQRCVYIKQSAKRISSPTPSHGAAGHYATLSVGGVEFELPAVLLSNKRLYMANVLIVHIFSGALVVIS